MPARRAHVVLNGVDLDRATVAKTSREEMRAHLGVDSDAVVFLAFGRDRSGRALM
jgi:hypothetical protein